MKITLSYAFCKAERWNHKFDYVGTYVEKSRKSPEEIASEKAFNKKFGLLKKVSPYKEETKSVFTFRDNEPDTCYFLLGSWDMLRTELDKLGEPYALEQKFDEAIMPKPDLSVLADVDLREGQAETLALLTTAKCGMICSTVSFGKSFIINLLCQMYPTLNILIVCSMTQVINQLYRDINKSLPGQVGLLTMNSSNIDGKRIICTTPQSCVKLHPERVQLTLVDECNTIAYNASFGDNIERFCFGRRFGFTATPIRNSDSIKTLEALYGPILQDFTFQEAEAAGNVTPIKYCMVPVDKKSDYLADTVKVIRNGEEQWVRETEVSPIETIYDRKKKELPDYMKQKLFYVSNYNRNDVIVDTFYKLKEANPDIQILLMTQSLEHLLRLHQRLKCCLFVHGERGSLEKFSKKKGLANVDMSKYKQSADDVDRIKGALSKGTVKYCISTNILGAGVNLTHLAVLIRCDAAVSGIPSIQIPGRLARLDEGKDVGYLIDFSDEFCTEAKGRAIARTRKYKTQGWSEIGLDEILTKLKQKYEDSKMDPLTQENNNA